VVPFAALAICSTLSFLVACIGRQIRITFAASRYKSNDVDLDVPSSHIPASSQDNPSADR
jgi:hypothetical protein